MKPIQKNISLKSLNTFGIDAKAKLFASFESIQELKELLESTELKNEKLLLLGGGSNLLFLSNTFNGVVLQNKIKGINIILENENEVIIKSGAGEIWHELVLFTISKNWGGLENLSLIPGTVGAAPMQNIGAYELK